MKNTLLPPATRMLAAGPCKRAAAVVAVAAMVLLAGCGGSAGHSGHAGSSASADPDLGKVTTDANGVQEVTIQTPEDYKFLPKHFTVAPGEVRLTVVNVAEQMTHNFEFTPGGGPAEIDAKIDLLAPGDRKTIEFTVTTPGDYAFECSFHAQLGQVGTMTVSAP
jgi:plastocyanin